MSGVFYGPLDDETLDALQDSIVAVKHNRDTACFRYEIRHCGEIYEAVVDLDLGGRAHLRSVRKQGAKRETRHGMTRTRIREWLESDAARRSRRTAEAHARKGGA